MDLKILWACLATAGYALMTRMSPADIAIAALAGALGWAAYAGAGLLFGNDYASYFLAALAVGIFAELSAALRRRPATIYAVPAVIPLVPGAGMFATLRAALSASPAAAPGLALQTLFIAGCIAAGIALASSLFRIIPLGRRGAEGRPAGGGQEGR